MTAQCGNSPRKRGTSLAHHQGMFRNIVEESEPKPAPVEESRNEVDESMLLAEDDLYDNMPCTD